MGNVGEDAFALWAVEDERGEGRREFFCLGHPVGDDGGGRDDEDGAFHTALFLLENVGESLQGFSEAHVVGKDTVEIVSGEEAHPFHAGFLVVAELGEKAFGLFEMAFVLLVFFEAGAELDEFGGRVDGEGFVVEERGGIERVKRGCFRVGQRGEVVEDGAKSSGGDLEGAATGKVDEVGFVVFEILELVERVAFEEAGEDGEEVETFTIEINADREREPTAGRGFERGVEFFVVEAMNLEPEVGIDFYFPAFRFEHGHGLGAEPGPVDRGSGEVGFGKPTSFGGEFGGLFFGQRKKEAVGGIGREIGEAELGEFFHGAELGGPVAGDGGFLAGFDERKFVRSVADDWAGDEPGITLF